MKHESNHWRTKYFYWWKWRHIQKKSCIFNYQYKIFYYDWPNNILITQLLFQGLEETKTAMIESNWHNYCDFLIKIKKKVMLKNVYIGGNGITFKRKKCFLFLFFIKWKHFYYNWVEVMSFSLSFHPAYLRIKIMKWTGKFYMKKCKEKIISFCMMFLWQAKRIIVLYSNMIIKTLIYKFGLSVLINCYFCYKLTMLVTF